MRKVAKYFGQTSTYGTEIQSTITTETTKIIMRIVRVNTGDADINNKLLGKELSEWLQRTRKLLENMGHAYNSLLSKCTTFTRSKLKSLKGLEAMS